MRKLMLVLFFAPCLTACAAMTMANIPDFAPIHEDDILLIAKDTDIGGQVVYKDQQLKPFIVAGKRVYCTDIYSLDYEKYRCFAGSDGLLTEGMNPRKFTWHGLGQGIETRRVASK